jgi:uncharacterized cupin superfamily protein
MSEKTAPAIAADSVPSKRGASYPAPFDQPCAARERRALGDAFGLNDFGVNLMTLPPGVWSSQRHWHSHEDEFVYVLAGNPTLVTDAGRTRLAPGMCAGFPAGAANGHHLVNETDAPVTLLEVGSRKPDDDCYYADIDMQILKRNSRDREYTRRDGTPYPG